MPVLSTAYYSNYSSNSSPLRNGSSSSSFSSLRPYSSSSLSSKSRSSYDLTQYRPANYLAAHPITTPSYKPPSGPLSTNTSYYSNRYSTGISGKNISSIFSSNSLNRFNCFHSSVVYLLVTFNDNYLKDSDLKCFLRFKT